MKICLACSAGGHLSEMLQLASVYKKHEYFFVTFKRVDTESLRKKEPVYFATRPGRNPISTINCFLDTLKILIKEKPDLIISTGADVTIPMCVLSKVFGKKVIFIESFCRTLYPSWSGKIAYLFADEFIVQWKPLLKYYKRAIYGGPIF